MIKKNQANLEKISNDTAIQSKKSTIKSGKLNFNSIQTLCRDSLDKKSNNNSDLKKQIIKNKSENTIVTHIEVVVDKNQKTCSNIEVARDKKMKNDFTSNGFNWKEQQKYPVSSVMEASEASKEWNGALSDVASVKKKSAMSEKEKVEKKVESRLNIEDISYFCCEGIGKCDEEDNSKTREDKNGCGVKKKNPEKKEGQKIFMRNVKVYDKEMGQSFGVEGYSTVEGKQNRNREDEMSNHSSVSDNPKRYPMNKLCTMTKENGIQTPVNHGKKSEKWERFLRQEINKTDLNSFPNKKVSFMSKAEKNIFPDEEISEMELFNPNTPRKSFSITTSRGQENDNFKYKPPDYFKLMARDKSNNSISRSDCQTTRNTKFPNILQRAFKPGAQIICKKQLKRHAFLQSHQGTPRFEELYSKKNPDPKLSFKSYDDTRRNMYSNQANRNRMRDFRHNVNSPYNTTRSERSFPTQKKKVVVVRSRTPHDRQLKSLYTRKPSQVEENISGGEFRQEKTQHKNVSLNKPLYRNQKLGWQISPNYADIYHYPSDSRLSQTSSRNKKNSFHLAVKDKVDFKNKSKTLKNPPPLRQRPYVGPKSEEHSVKPQEHVEFYDRSYLNSENDLNDNYLANLSRWRSRNVVSEPFNHCDVVSSSCFLTLDEYKIFGTIADVHYGKILVGNNVNHNKKCVIRMIQKKFILGNDPERLFDLAQTNLYVPSIVNKCPFFIGLFDIFQTDGHYFFIQEFSEFVSLNVLIKCQGYFEESQVKFYSAGILLALNYLHRLNIIHRNLRLSNVLVDKRGYPKLSDFGRARHYIAYKDEKKKNELSQDLDGMTNIQYMAPEIFCSPSHDRMADYWSLGVCIQYMMTGKLVANWRYLIDYMNEIEGSYCSESTNLIKSLIKINPFLRLGSGPLGTVEIMNHVFYQVFNWDRYTNKEYIVPIPNSQCQTLYTQLKEDTYIDLKETVKAFPKVKDPEIDFLPKKANEQNEISRASSPKCSTLKSVLSNACSQKAECVEEKLVECSPNKVTINTLHEPKQSYQFDSIQCKQDQKLNIDQLIKGPNTISKELDFSSMLVEIKSELERYKSGFSGRTQKMDMKKLHTQDEMISKLMDLKSCSQTFKFNSPNENVPFVNTPIRTSPFENSSFKNVSFRKASIENSSIGIASIENSPISSSQEANKKCRTPKTKEFSDTKNKKETLKRKGSNDSKVNKARTYPRSALKTASMTDPVITQTEDSMYDSYTSSTSTTSSSSGKYTKKTSKKKEVKKKRNYSSSESAKSTNMFKSRKTVVPLNNPLQFIMNSTPSHLGHSIIQIFDKDRYTGVSRTQKNKKTSTKKEKKKKKKYREP